MAVLRVKTTFIAATADRRRTLVTAGTLVDSDDPVVKGRESLFDPVEAVVRRVEAATAAPGEKRAVKRLAKGV